MLLLATGALLIAACTPSGSVDPEPLDPPEAPVEDIDESPEGEYDLGFEPPPDVVVTAGDVELMLQPWTACWGNGCYDGPPPEDLAEVGSPTEILVEFPVPGWEFSATVQPTGEECGRRQTEPLERIGETKYVLRPIGLAGDYEVTLFGRGPGGDVFVSFRWVTLEDGALPVPEATATIVAEHDGVLDSYGAEVSVWNLAATPVEASGEVKVTAAEGGSHTFALDRENRGCWEGTVSFTAPVEEGLAAVEAGSPPFSYEVTLVLDGQTYTGVGIWPDGVDPECAPCVTLSFDPPLPALVDGAGGKVEAVEIDGVWLFRYSLRPDAIRLTALHGGTAEIVDGCLYVDDTVVLWPAELLDQAAELVAAAKRGERPAVTIGGGGMSLAEGSSRGDIPEVITEVCPEARAVWVAAP
jgi:hypothetical protein